MSRGREPAVQCHRLSRHLRCSDAIDAGADGSRTRSRSGSYQGTARPTTLSISARTRRSTSGGRLPSSHSFSSGRISSRTRSSIVGPPRIDLRRAAGRQGAQQATDRGCSGGGGFRRQQVGDLARRFRTDRLAAGGGGGDVMAGGSGPVRGRLDGCPPGGSAPGPADRRRVSGSTGRIRRVVGVIIMDCVQHQHIVVRAGGFAAAPPPSRRASSSFRMRRMEARISSIDGSAPSGVAGRRSVCRSSALLRPSAARLIGRVVAEADPAILHRL